ncbi:uncharacterized protein LOC135479698 [Liolophura sinensis]|uniref:uncharacterized protein LOC135479698 n=1 Tax=Liolophura sinensis TaxID=3198878 RepID=UPI003158F007
MEGIANVGQPDTKLRESKEDGSTGSHWYSSIWSRQNVPTVQSTDRTVKTDQSCPSQADVKESGSMASTQCNPGMVGGQNLQVKDETVDSCQQGPRQEEIKDTVRVGSTQCNTGVLGRQSLQVMEGTVNVGQTGPKLRERIG